MDGPATGADAAPLDDLSWGSELTACSAATTACSNAGSICVFSAFVGEVSDCNSCCTVATLGRLAEVVGCVWALIGEEAVWFAEDTGTGGGVGEAIICLEGGTVEVEVEIGIVLVAGIETGVGRDELAGRDGTIDGTAEGLAESLVGIEMLCAD